MWGHQRVVLADRASHTDLTMPYGCMQYVCVCVWASHTDLTMPYGCMHYVCVCVCVCVCLMYTGVQEGGAGRHS